MGRLSPRSVVLSVAASTFDRMILEGTIRTRDLASARTDMFPAPEIVTKCALVHTFSMTGWGACAVKCQVVGEAIRDDRE